jgi:hypothetical protein
MRANRPFVTVALTAAMVLSSCGGADEPTLDPQNVSAWDQMWDGWKQPRQQRLCDAYNDQTGAWQQVRQELLADENLDPTYVDQLETWVVMRCVTYWADLDTPR